MQTPPLLNKHALRALVGLVKYAVQERTFRQIQAVVELGPGVPVGLLNITKSGGFSALATSNNRQAAMF